MKCWRFTAAFLGAVTLTGGDTGAQGPSPAGGARTTSPTGNGADRAAIEKQAHAFAEAFNRGDARAIAAMWTENGESREVGGKTFVGRAAIEKAYAELFKANAGIKLDVLVKSVRFPAKDMAVEEGLLRSSRGPKDLPATSTYVAVHVREAGQWKIALASEGGAGQDRLEDLDWLLGDWTTKVKDGAVQFSFARDPKAPAIRATFKRTPSGKEPIRGSIRIAFDPETGQIRSWGFEDDGAHSQALWFCDGKSWVLDARGVLADGTPTAERLVLQRVSPDVITWRAIDRLLGETRLPDTPPLRLTRTASPAPVGTN
jgi:uncharacterized protein (TIGR02246 family)